MKELFHSYSFREVVPEWVQGVKRYAGHVFCCMQTERTVYEYQQKSGVSEKVHTYQLIVFTACNHYCC